MSTWWQKDVCCPKAETKIRRTQKQHIIYIYIMFYSISKRFVSTKEWSSKFWPAYILPNTYIYILIQPCPLRRVISTSAFFDQKLSFKIVRGQIYNKSSINIRSYYWWSYTLISPIETILHIYIYMHTSYYIIEYMCINNVCPESVYSYPLSCKYSCHMSIYIYAYIFAEI